MWEREFEAPIEDFTYLTNKNSLTLSVVITSDNVYFFTTQKPRKISTKNYQIDELEGWYCGAQLSRNGKYIGISKHHIADYGRIQEDSEFRLYDRKGTLLVTRKVTNNYKPGTVLNNGAFLASGVLEDGNIYYERLNGEKDTLFKCSGMSPSTFADFAEKSTYFVINFSGIGVILYNTAGHEIWCKNLEDSHASGVAISTYGSYIAAFGKSGGKYLLVYAKDGNLMWEKEFRAGTHLLSFSPEENYLAIYDHRSGLYCFQVESGVQLWHYPTDKIKKRLDHDLDLARSIFALDVSFYGSFVGSADGAGDRETPAGNVSIVRMFDKKGSIVWEKEFKIQNRRVPKVRFTDDGNYLCITNSNKFYCYEILESD